MRIVRRALLALVPAMLLIPLTSILGTPAVSSANPALTQTQRAATKTGKPLQQVSSGTQVAFQDERAIGSDAQAGGPADLPPNATASSLGCANRGSATNPRVNQDCTLRRQAEEQLAVNPRDPNNLIAGQNDSRVGFNKCGFDYSLNGGKTWGDGIPPFLQHLNPGTNHTYDAASDPAVTFDGQGRAWYSCVTFDLADNASAVMATPSTPLLKGSAYTNVAAGASPFVITENDSAAHLFDKEFIAGDPRSGSTSVYETWTDFFSDPRCVTKNNSGGQCSSSIFYSHWDGAAWSKPKLVSGNSPLCTGSADPKANAHACDNDQGSNPIVDPSDGSAFVVWNNGNTPSALGQQLGRRINTDGSMGPIVKVGIDDLGNPSLCNFGRGPEQCVRQINVRSDDYPQIAMQPTNHNHLVSDWTDTRNVNVNGTGNYDVVVSESFDGGATWTDTSGGGKVLNPVPGGSYFEPGVAITPGGQVGVSEYQANAHPGTDGMGTYGYGMEVRPTKNGAFSAYTPVSDSQTNPSPQSNPQQAGFLGDYSGMAAARNAETFYPIWSDTRNTSTVVGPDEDVFTAQIAK